MMRSHRQRYYVIGLTIFLLVIVVGMMVTQAQSSTPTSGTTPTAADYDCPCSIWGTPTPRTKNSQDTAGVEIGVKFRAAVDGYITGIRFYKGSANTGEHSGHLWTADGDLLAEVVFTDETASGWQEATFEAPVAISADTVYVASYHTASGWYSLDRPSFGKDVVNGPLTALKSRGNGGNGVYIYSGKPRFPNQTYEASNYWVDVIFVTELPEGIEAAATPTAG